MSEKEKTPFYLYKRDDPNNPTRNPADVSVGSTTTRGGRRTSVEPGSVNPLNYSAVKECPRPAAAVYEAEIKTLTDALTNLRHEAVNEAINKNDLLQYKDSELTELRLRVGVAEEQTIVAVAGSNKGRTKSVDVRRLCMSVVR